jgi:hypothetical protein
MTPGARRRLALVITLVGLTIRTTESRQQTTVASEAVEPAPITAGRPPAPGEYSTNVDALHYDIRLTLPSAGAVIEGTTEIQLALSAAAPDTLALDFTGLSVTTVTVNGTPTRFARDAGKLMIPVPPARGRTRRIRVAIAYRGTPDDGLIIRNNVHGHRTAFADNWPNRARFWFPSLDHPADKATAAFTILAPPGWDVVANGRRTGPPVDIRASDGAVHRRYQWRIAEPISTYNMVFGAADFQVATAGRVCRTTRRCVDVTTWVFPESAGTAAASFRRQAMVEYFSQLIAPFPYETLAHVLSSTRFGGMENATAIFYDEQPLADGRNIESTVAHETAHQWFGDSVTEADWPDLWLSEGFATYFGALFFEHADGVDAFRQIMEASRRRLVSADRLDARSSTHRRRISSRCSTATTTRRAPGSCTCCAGCSVTNGFSTASAATTGRTRRQRSPPATCSAPWKPHRAGRWRPSSTNGSVSRASRDFAFRLNGPPAGTRPPLSSSRYNRPAGRRSRPRSRWNSGRPAAACAARWRWRRAWRASPYLWMRNHLAWSSTRTAGC